MESSDEEISEPLQVGDSGGAGRDQADRTFFNPPSFFSSKQIIKPALQTTLRDKPQGNSEKHVTILDRSNGADRNSRSSAVRKQSVSASRKTNSFFRVVNRRMSASPKFDTQTSTNKDNTGADETTIEFETYHIRDKPQKGSNRSYSQVHLSNSSRKPMLSERKRKKCGCSSSRCSTTSW